MSAYSEFEAIQQYWRQLRSPNDSEEFMSRNAGFSGVPDIVFRSPTLPLLGRRTEEYRLSDRKSTDANDRAVDSRVVLVRTHDRF
jgi:hypothetical protein